MSTLLLTFANSNTSPLPTLADEYRGLNDALRTRNAARDFSTIYAPIATRDDIIKDIRANQNDISLFLFSGHAGRDRIILTDGGAPSDALADSLGNCPNLKLVILNGCSTEGQVKALLNKNIPIVIATSSPVNDEKATKFSIAFFREMAIDRTINEAFEIAVDESNWYGSKQEAENLARGLVLERNDDDKPMWGIYYSQPEGEIFMNTFRLPRLAANNDGDGINDELADALLGISEKYKVDPSKEKMLALLPYLISEPIRKLLTKKEGNGVFYDSPSKERFKMLLFAYRAIINLATYTLLATLWDEALKKGNKSRITGEGQKRFATSFFKESQNINPQSNLELLKLLLQVMKEADLSCFIVEMDVLLDKLNEKETRKALDVLESKIAKESENSGAPDLLNQCLETERSLARILFDFGFMIQYSLTSVPNIEFLKNQRLKSQLYRHRFLTLRNQGDALRKDDEQFLNNSSLDNSSIIIHRHNDRSTERNLNLSPFLVDKNALDNAGKPDLHFLVHFSELKNTFYYCPATSYKNLWEVVPGTNIAPVKSKYSASSQTADKSDLSAPPTFNSLLLDQIRSFSQIVLDKTLREP
ncbi:hypothetical protein [Dyadobacter sp. 32]|uniref:hypothetical protein n=1 Tax=Dyadobacter sp. 32 TaxID=538966 RepID=UPI0011ECFA8B